MENTAYQPNRLLLLPVGIEAVETCERIARKVAKSVAIPFLFVSEPVGVEAERMFRVLVSMGANPLVGGVIIVSKGGGEIDPVSLAKAIIRETAKPVELIDIRIFGGTDKAVKYGIWLARSMLLLINHLQRSLKTLPKKVLYEGGSRWLDDDLGGRKEDCLRAATN